MSKSKERLWKRGMMADKIQFKQYLTRVKCQRQCYKEETMGSIPPIPFYILKDLPVDNQEHCI